MIEIDKNALPKSTVKAFSKNGDWAVGRLFITKLGDIWCDFPGGVLMDVTHYKFQGFISR